MKDIARHASRLNTFQGRAKIRITSETAAFNGSLVIKAKLPDSLWVQVRGPIGIYIGAVLVGKDSVFLYNAWENIAYRGSADRISAGDLFQLDTNIGTVLSGIVGLPVPQYFLCDTTATISVDDRGYRLFYPENDLFWVIPGGPAVARWEKRDDSGAVLWSWSAGRFIKRSGIYLPRLIRITNHAPEQQLTVLYNEIWANKKMRSPWFEMDIPEGVPVHDL